MHWNANENRYAACLWNVGIQSWGVLGWPCGNTTRRRWPDSLGGRTQAEFVQDTNETFEATIYGHYFVDPGGCGGEIVEMRKRVVVGGIG
jgi:hypothetical protein